MLPPPHHARPQEQSHVPVGAGHIEGALHSNFILFFHAVRYIYPVLNRQHAAICAEGGSWAMLPPKWGIFASRC